MEKAELESIEARARETIKSVVRMLETTTAFLELASHVLSPSRPKARKRSTKVPGEPARAKARKARP